ncbi:MAG: hypothetical protein RMM53_06725, partial [Bacteroidia bacterium]|nr:hypothetical protein [Bacteroidia bacterium]
SDTVYTLPLKADFEDGRFPPQGWKILNPDSANTLNNFTFAPRSGASGFGTGSRCAFVQHFRYNGYGQRDALVSPSFDIPAADRALLNFAVAYSPLQSSAGGFPFLYTDTLRVEISEDCGATWKPLYAKGGLELMTVAAPKNDEIFIVFNDRPDVWRQEAVNLAPYIGKSRLQIKFETVNGYGNNLFLDDIRIETFTDTVPQDTETVRAAPKLKNFWLHAADERVHLHFPARSPFVVETYDVQGRRIARKNFGPGDDFVVAEALPAGLYSVKILSPEGWAVSKVVLR